MRREKFEACAAQLDDVAAIDSAMEKWDSCLGKEGGLSGLQVELKFGNGRLKSQAKH